MTILLGRYRKEDAGAQKKVIQIEAERRAVQQQARKLLSPKKLGQGSKDSPLEPWREQGPAAPSVRTSDLQNYEREIFVAVSPQVWGP